MLAAARVPEGRDDPRHVSVLLDEMLAALAPLAGATVVDATFGAGGYSRAILRAGAARVLGIDRDPSALAVAEDDPRLTLVEGRFGELDRLLADVAPVEARVDAVVLDIGVSSMQLDQAERGFSFMADGPLDMRMSGAGQGPGQDGGPSAADLVNRADEGVLADILFDFGEDRAARRIARAIVRARAAAPITRTLQLAEIVGSVLPRQRPGQVHPATRTFQALRIAVNDELGELARGLAAAERVLAPGGRLAVVTFHSLEDRIVKRYLQGASAALAGGSRHAPARALPPPRFEPPAAPVTPGPAELAHNPRARSARLRSAVRTEAPPVDLDPRALGLPSAPLAADILGRRS
jgi:16S rRNA (cytosine1402-N4)-methyltransferase